MGRGDMTGASTIGATSHERTSGRRAVAVVGCGRIGAQFHVPALAGRDDVELRALVDPRGEDVARLADRYGIPNALTAVDGLAGLGVTAAVVSVPNRLHAPVAVALLEQGIDVLVEKPLAPTVAECDQIAAAAGRAGRTAAVALPLRASPPARLARDLLARGDLGKIVGVELGFSSASARPAVTDPRRQRETVGGGVLLDLGSHVLDLLVWWFGDLVVAGYRDDAHGGVEAEAVVDLTLPDGGGAVVELSWTRDLAQLAVLRGESGILEVGLGNDHVAWRSAAGEGGVRGTVDDGGGPDAKTNLAVLVRRVHDDFLAAAGGERTSSVPLDEATRTVELIERCYRQRVPLVPPWVGIAPLRGESAPDRDPPATLRGARVLVTGATGFIGGGVVEELVLTHGAEVRALARRGSPVARLLRFPIDLVWGSVTDPEAVAEAVRGCDVVIHCAHGAGSLLRNVRTGVWGTRTVVEAARTAGVGRLVHLSSAVVYGTTRDGDLDEGSPYGRTRDPYALAKRGGERVVETGHDAGLPSVILQPTTVYGPWGKRWTASVVEQMGTGSVPVLDAGRGLCNAVYVDDVVSAILLAATAERAPGERFLVSAAEPVTWGEFYAGFEAVVGRKATVAIAAGALGGLARAQRRRLRRTLARDVSSRARGVLADREARMALRALPSIRLAMSLAEDVAGGRWARLKREVVAGAAGSGSSDRRGFLHVPGENVIISQRSRTRVRIDHARRLIGYEPAYDFERGMAATGAFLRWARLAGPADA